jgi:hypothetical protein
MPRIFQGEVISRWLLLLLSSAILGFEIAGAVSAQPVNARVVSAQPSAPRYE